MLGDLVTATIQQPYGQAREGLRSGLPVNIGVVHMEEEPMRAYILGSMRPLRQFHGQVVALIEKQNGEKACVLAPEGKVLLKPDMVHELRFERLASAYWKCLYEKACGAILFDRYRRVPHYILIENRGSHWGFPKGHVEYGETEMQTALREIREETGIHATFIRGFRRVIRYRVFDSTQKVVVYFLARSNGKPVRIQQEEISDFAVLPFEAALERLTYDSERDLLRHANQFLRN